MDGKKSFCDSNVHNVPVIVLSGGLSNNFRALCKTIPKALLKVGDRTLIYNTLHNLYVSGFRDIRIITNKESVDVIEEHIKLEFTAVLSMISNVSLDRSPNITVYGLISDDVHFGTVDVIRYISNFVEGDFLIVPCDIYGVFDFKCLLMEHLKSKRLCTVALMEDDTLPNRGDKSRLQIDKLTLGGNDIVYWNYKYRVIATLDDNKNQIMGLSHSITIESGDDYRIFKWHLLTHPQCKIRKDLVDPHIYIFSDNIFKIINSSSFEGSSIRLDLIPYIITMQETPNIISLIRPNEVTDLCHSNYCLDHQDSKDITRVFYFLTNGSNFKCQRINSIDSLFYANMLCVSRTRTCSSKIGGKVKTTIIGKNTNIDTNINIKNSSIGSNVIIGERAKITNSVIMDGCILKNDVVIDRSIIGDSVTIGNNTTLKNTIVLSNTNIQCNTFVEKDFIPPFIDTQ